MSVMQRLILVAKIMLGVVSPSNGERHRWREVTQMPKKKGGKGC